MAIVSYGTITITDTNDIERIYTVYAKSTTNTTAPSAAASSWTESISTAPGSGDYVWQRTVVEKSGTGELIYGNPVCVTGPEGDVGATGKGVKSLVTQYYLSTSSSSVAGGSWNTTPQSYPATGTKYYWTKTITTYTDNTTYESTAVYDVALTSSVKDARDANVTANEAKDIAQQTSTDVTNLQTRTKYFWTNLTAHTNGSGGWTKPNYPVGTFAASGISGTTFDYENSNTYGYNTLYSNGIKLRYNAINLGELTGTALTFYHPSISNQGAKAMELGATALKFYDATGSIVQAEFGGTQAKISGTINAYDGKIGNNNSNYWYIGNYTDYNQNDSAIIKSIGTASIQLNETNTWRVATNRIHTAWAPSTGTDAFKLHFPIFNDSESNSKHWDYGLHLPTSNTDKFLYIRNAPSTQTLDNLLDDLEDSGYNYWTYKFYVDGEGNLHAGDIYSHDTLISGTSAPYLLKSGGTMTGSITMSNGSKLIGDVTGNVSGSAGKLSNTSIIGNTNKPVYFTANGVPAAISYEINKSVPSDAVFTDKNVQTTKANTTKIYLTGTQTNGTNTGTLNFDEYVYVDTTAGALHATTFNGYTLAAAAAKGVDTSMTATSTSTNLPTTKAVADLIATYLPLAGGTVSGAVDINDELYADSATFGNLIVNGVGRFTNGIYGDLIGSVTGNITGNASTADKVNKDLKIQLNGGTTEGTNQFTFNGSVAKTVNITKSSIGLGNVDNTTDANKPVSTAQETALKLRGSEFIAGTQTATTGSWTGVSTQAALYDGMQIDYWLPYGGSGNATLNLTLSNGTTTGAINCYYSGTTRLTTHYSAGNIIHMIYRVNVPIAGSGSYTGWWADAQYYWYPAQNTLCHYNNILAKEAITADSLIVGDVNGYQKVGSGVTYDISYPIVWCTGAVSKNTSNYANMFLQHYDRNIATGAKSGFTSAANKVIYLVVTISGKTATIDSTIITDTLPSTDDGKVYVVLGKLGAQSTGANYFFLYPEHPMLWYKNGAVRVYGGNAENANTVNGHTVNKDVPSNAIFTDTWKALSTSQAGYVSQAPNDTGKFLRGDATWAAVTKSNVGLSNVTNDAQIPKSVFTGAYQLLYSTAANTSTTLAPNTTSTKKFLRMTGTGSVGATPAWDTVTKSDVGLDNVLDYAQITNITNQTDSQGHNTGKLLIWKGTTSSVLEVEITATESSTATTAQKAINDADNDPIKSNYAHSISISGHTITLKDKSGNTLGSSITVPDNNTTYTFEGGTNQFKVTPLGGTAQTVTVTPSITNNITGSGTSGYLVKFNGANTITNGPALGTDTTKFLNNKGEWVVPSGTYSLPLATNGTRGGVQIGYTQSGKNYPVQLSSEKMYVNVPWENTTYSAGNGLRLNGTQFINTRIPFVAGTQTAQTGSWTGVCNDITVLYDGLTIAYWLPRAGSGNATLNLTINGNDTGAKNCYYSGTTRLTTHFGAGNIIYLTYQSAANINGTTYEGWWANANYDSNDTGYYHRRIYPNMKVGSNKIYPYTLIMQLPDGRWESLVTSNSTGTSKARNTHGFLLGHILLMYYNETYTENQNLSTYRIWSAHTGLIDHRYSFNTANDATNGTIGYKPIYLVGSLGSDGLFYLADKWWTQTLPTTADGKIYIYIGDAYDYYRMTFTEDKPMYIYTNGKLREFSQDAATVAGYTVAKDVPSNAVFTDTWKALSTSQAGYVAQAPNDTGKFLRGDATWAAVTKANVGLGNVENTALSTWAGSSNITKLGTISTGTWNGSAIPIANGGTGATTAANAINALLGGLPVWTANPTDSTYFIRQDTGGAASYGKVQFSTLWNYIDGKISSSNKYVTIAGDSETITGTKVFNNLLGTKYVTTKGGNGCEINYNSSLEALVFSFS